MGSSPGTGWLIALSFLGDTLDITLVSIDPRDLDKICGFPGRISHTRTTIKNAQDLLRLVPSTSEAILIWDARNDFSEESKDEVVREDISILNGILTSQDIYRRFKYMHIKVNTSNVELYTLPEGGRFYPQPFTLERDVYEIRYVWHHPGHEDICLMSPTRDMANSLTVTLEDIQSLLRKNGVHVTTHRLIANYLTSRVRPGDYISLESNFKVKEEIFLFTINHNSPERTLLRLQKLKRDGVDYFGSFFTGEALDEDPFSFPEGEFLLNGLGTILDSRSIINAKIESLYFFYVRINTGFVR